MMTRTNVIKLLIIIIVYFLQIGFVGAGVELGDEVEQLLGIYKAAAVGYLFYAGDF